MIKMEDRKVVMSRAAATVEKILHMTILLTFVLRLVKHLQEVRAH